MVDAERLGEDLRGGGFDRATARKLAFDLCGLLPPDERLTFAADMAGSDARLEKEINRLGGRMDRVESRLQAVDRGVTALGGRMDQLESRMLVAEGRVADVQKHIDRIDRKQDWQFGVILGLFAILTALSVAIVVRAYFSP